MSNKPYPTFTTTDTLNQMVVKLVTLTDNASEELTSINSKDSDLGIVFNAATGVQNYHDDLTVYANNAKYALDSDFEIMSNKFEVFSKDAVTISAGDASSVTKHKILIRATNNIDLVSENNQANITLSNLYGQYGRFKNNAGDLIINSASEDMILFNGASKNSTFKGNITMPTSGVGAPTTNSKTVAGAINELRAAIIALGGSL